MSTQRDIKFRAYHFASSTMFDVHELNLNNSGMSVRCRGSRYGTMQVGKDCGLREFTGLKDKNGAEVYEGDIIDFTECDPLPDGSWLRTVVRWNEKDCQFDYGPVSFWIGHVSSDGEVIGNIYEHPELLKA